MSDLIDREFIKGLGGECIARRDRETGELIAITGIDLLPSAQPMRKKGRWKRRLVDSGFNADWYCSECGWKTALEEHGYNYCPNCGAKMEGEG